MTTRLCIKCREIELQHGYLVCSDCRKGLSLDEFTAILNAITNNALNKLEKVTQL